MRWDWQVVTWAAVALLLFAAETMAPGAFMLWLGFAAAAVFVVVLLFDLPVLAQVALFVVLSFISIQVYRRWFRGRERASDQPTLNRRADALVGPRGAAGARDRRRPAVACRSPMRSGTSAARTWPRARRCASSPSMA